MFLYLLGLKSRLMRWPFATIALVLVTTGLSVLELSHQPANHAAVKAMALESQVWQSRVTLLNHICLSTFEDAQAPSRCQYLSSTLKPEDFADLAGFLQTYKLKAPKDNGADFKRWVVWLKQEEVHRTVSTEAKADPVVKAYEATLKVHRSQLVEAGKKTNSLMRGNIRILPAAKALFLHSNWPDLVGSLLVLILFGLFLEQRVGPVGMVVIYILGGIGGNLLQAAFIPLGASMMGASAAVSAALGAFLIYFSQEKSYLGLNLLVYRRELAFPAWAYVCGAWALSDLLSFVTGSHATHLAHGVGFALGAILASMQKDLFPLKKTFLFPHEQAMYYTAKESAKFDEKLKLFQKIYKLNQESFYAFRTLFAYFEKHRLAMTSFGEEDRDFVRKILTECFNYTRKNEKYDFSQQVLGLVPLWWDLNSLEITISADNLIDRADRFHQSGFIIQGLRFYDLFLEKYAAHPKSQGAHSVIMQVFDELEKFDPTTQTEMLDVLTEYAKAHPTTHLQSQIRRLAHHLENEIRRGAA